MLFNLLKVKQQTFATNNKIMITRWYVTFSYQISATHYIKIICNSKPFSLQSLRDRWQFLHH